MILLAIQVIEYLWSFLPVGHVMELEQKQPEEDA